MQPNNILVCTFTSLRATCENKRIVNLFCFPDGDVSPSLNFAEYSAFVTTCTRFQIVSGKTAVHRNTAPRNVCTPERRYTEILVHRIARAPKRPYTEKRALKRRNAETAFNETSGSLVSIARTDKHWRARHFSSRSRTRHKAYESYWRGIFMASDRKSVV